MSASAQSIPRWTEAADELYDQHRYIEAIEYYEKIAGIDKQNYRAKYRLGYCLLQSLQYEEAEEAFLELSSISNPANTFRSEALYRYATLLMTNGSFNEADSLFAFVISITADQELLKLARKRKEGCLLALRQQQLDRGFSVGLLEGLNSKFHDFGGTLNPGNKQLVFATTRNLGGTQYSGVQFEGVLPDLASFEWARDRWRNNSNEQRFSRINTEWSEGAGSFTKDGATFYFSSCKGEESSGCLIMVTYLVDGRWSEPTALNEYINEAGTESKQPHVSATGDTLFFSSDRSGGFGGSDIWMSLKGLDPESWTPAINMGNTINTAENDITPYYSSAYNCLLFSSNGHIGYGGYDIYAAKGESFFEPDVYNLGAPFNSSLDDTYFNISDTVGFISSNREDRKSLNLYSFDLKDERLFLSLLISGESRIDSRVISRFRDVRSLDLFAFRVEDYAGYELFAPEKRTKPKPSIIAALEEGDGGGQSTAGQNSDPAGYISASVEKNYYAGELITGASPYTVDYEHVYFKLNSSQLEPVVKKSLQDLVAQLDPSIINSIEILSYTDIDGSPEFNKKLSHTRGEMIRSYMVSLGVPADRVVVRARGEGPLSSRTSWYSKMFSRRAEIIVNGAAPLAISSARPFAVRYESTVSQIEEQLGVELGALSQWNDFKGDRVEAGGVIRIGDPQVIPNIKFFLEEADLRNSFFLYRVKSDDTLASIAAKYKTVEELLAEVNQIDQEVQEGDEIFIYRMQ